jgi:hypothetical protein
MNNSDLILGVLYGTENQLSQHYKKIDEKHPVIIGSEFWYRITGYPKFYDKLVINLDQMILSLNTEDFFQKGYLALAKEIEDSELFNFK